MSKNLFKKYIYKSSKDFIPYHKNKHIGSPDFGNFDPKNID